MFSRRARLLALVMVAALAPPVFAVDQDQQPDMLMYYRFDPTGFQPPALWLAPLIRMLDATGVVAAEDKPIADGILIASFLGSYRHELVMFDLKAYRYQPQELIVQQLQLVLAIDAPGQFAQIRQSLETILSHYGRPRQRRQTSFELPAKRFAVRYRGDDWPPWLTLEWAADPRRFYLGIGHGSLQRWFGAAGPVAHDARLDRHREHLDHDPQPFLEIFADFDSLRAAVPTLFETGRTSPMLGLFELDGASQWMLHGRWSDTFLKLDVTTRRDQAAPGAS